MAKNNWLEGLNPEQIEAVLHTEGPLLILAGAGSGKTTVLVARTGRLLSEVGVRPESVSVLTFTNKAAKELKERVSLRIGKAAKDLWTGTFHSFGLVFLKQHYKLAGLPKSFGVIDGGDARSIVRDLLKDIKHTDKENFDPERLLQLIYMHREGGLSKNFENDPYFEMAEMLAPRYVRRLETLGVVDFEALLLKPLEILMAHPEVKSFYHQSLQQIMVDEFQDTNSLQMRLIRQLLGPHQNITVVGDDDQSIYGWRGACIDNILGFPRQFEDCKMVRLERNYRSSPAILKLANDLIQSNNHRHQKILRSQAQEQGSLPELFVYENEEDEAQEVVQNIHYFQGQGYSLDQIAILYRSNSQGGFLEGVLRFHGLPYSLTGGTTFFDRKEIKDVLAYLRCALAPHELALRRILNTPARGLGERAVDWMCEYQEAHKVSFWQAFKALATNEDRPQWSEAVRPLLAVLADLPDWLLGVKPVGTDKQILATASERMVAAFRHVGYQDYVYSLYKDAGTAQKKWQLIEILGRVLDGFLNQGGLCKQSLKDFVDSMELRDIIEESRENSETARIQLLTLHASKGLEYPVVIILGLEEDILPHQKLGMDIDEERRLLYVGITRAKERLMLTRVRQRKRYGRLRPVSPSRFLQEMDGTSFVTYESGFRPINEAGRKTLIADLFKKIDSRSKAEI